MNKKLRLKDYLSEVDEENEKNNNYSSINAFLFNCYKFSIKYLC